MEQKINGQPLCVTAQTTWIQQGAVNIPQGLLVLADFIVIHVLINTFHMIPMLLCLVEIWAIGWKPRPLSCSLNTLDAMCACEMACHHTACICWRPWRPYHNLVSSMSQWKPEFFKSHFIFPLPSYPILVMVHIASFYCSLLTGVESGEALCCGPSNSRLNDVCLLKCPSAHCFCSELPFICGLLTWTILTVFSDLSHKPLRCKLWTQVTSWVNQSVEMICFPLFFGSVVGQSWNWVESCLRIVIRKDFS